MQAAAAVASSTQMVWSCSPALAAVMPSTAATHAESLITPHTRQSAGAHSANAVGCPAQQQHLLLYVVVWQRMPAADDGCRDTEQHVAL
jgi:hypothetical protein